MDWIVTFTAKKDSLYTNKSSSKGFLVDVNDDGTRDMTITSNKSEQYRYDAAGNVVASIKFEHLDKNAVAYTITPAHPDTLVATGALADSAGSATALRGSICPTEPPPTVDVMTVTYTDANGNTITVINGDLVPNNVMLTMFVNYKAAFPEQLGTELLFNGESYAFSDATTLTATLDTSMLAISNITFTARALKDDGTGKLIAIPGSEESLYFTVGDGKTPVPPGDTLP
jgi:hypothetical protein